jgi:hypothetical protein
LASSLFSLTLIRIQIAARLQRINKAKKVNRIADDGDVLAAFPGWSTSGVLEVDQITNRDSRKASNRLSLYEVSQPLMS